MTSHLLAQVLILTYHPLCLPNREYSDKFLNNVNPKKANGPDMIPCCILKEAAAERLLHSYSSYLHNLWNLQVCQVTG